MDINNIDRRSTQESIQEAEQRQLDFNPVERATEIRTMLREIPLEMSRGKTEIQLKEQFQQYSEKYPELFKKIINNADLTPIRTMLSMLDKIGEGSLSTHQASIIVGQRLVDKYIKPQLASSQTQPR